MNMKDLRNADPLKRTVHKQTDIPEHSPMDPPDPYQPPAAETVPYEDLPEFLQGLVDDHRAIREALSAFETLLGELRENGMTAGQQLDGRLAEFFRFLDEKVLPHSLKEEKLLFPRLHERLLEHGEHSQGHTPTTAVDMLEDDHTKVMQLAAVTFNFLALAVRLPDARSRAIVLDTAIEQGKALIEILRLHMFREDEVVFAMAVKYLTPDEFSEMA